MVNLDIIDAGVSMSSERKNLPYADRMAAAEADNDNLISAYHYHWPTHRLVPARGEYAPTDGVIISGGNVIAVYEAKARLLTHTRLVEEYNNEWLLSESKLEAGIAAAKALDCPFVGVIYCVPDQKIIRVKVWDSGEYSVGVRFAEETTDAGASGGTKTTRNAFIDLSISPVRGFGDEA